MLSNDVLMFVVSDSFGYSHVVAAPIVESAIEYADEQWLRDTELEYAE